MLTAAKDTLTADEEKTVISAIAALEEASKVLNDFMSSDWVGYQNNLANKQISLDAIIK